MIHRDFLHHLAFTFLASSLRGGLNSFCGTWLRCNSWEWGATKRCTKGPCEAGIGQRRGCRDCAMAPHPANRVAPSFGRHCSALRGRALPRRCALPCTPEPHTPPRPTTGFRLNGNFLPKTKNTGNDACGTARGGVTGRPSMLTGSHLHAQFGDQAFYSCYPLSNASNPHLDFQTVGAG